MRFVFASVTGLNNVADAALAGTTRRMVAPPSSPPRAENLEAWSPDAAAAIAAEATLVTAARGGERAAFGQIYETHYRDVYRLCRRIVGRDADAEDALQATFVKAFTALARFRGDCALRTWLYRIAVNEATTLLRQRAARPLSPLGSGDDLPHGATFADGPRANADEAEGIAERLAVRGLMEALRPDHRAILALRFWEELSYEEIAHVLNLSLPAMKMRLRRAKAEFRARWENDENASAHPSNPAKEVSR